jgi:chromosome segregation protein
LDDELRAIADRTAADRAEIERNGSECAAAERAASQLEADLQEGHAELTELRQRHAQLRTGVTDLQIAVARGEQRMEMLRTHLEQLQRTQQEREQILAESRERLANRETVVAELDQAIASERQSLAQLYLSKDRHAGMLAEQTALDSEVRRSRQALIERIREQRQQLNSLQNQHHKLEVAISRLRHERQTLSDRMLDDYGINLEEAGSGEQGVESKERGARSEEQSGQAPNSPAPSPQPPAPAFNREAVEQEIADLRDQINNIGAINLEALDELDQLESRFEKLSGQYRDLVDAKASLERITQRINADSRQLFLTTLETVRGHFQELFRRLFGGGEADIVLDEAVDVLDCGIEIVARPPGKEACSISLLSGGEKTLTCVALLLAVFRSKPSPFCVLDEVDAALDEANIGRFTAVLREFLSFTQFIVVTHSKKTMSGADTLYGVTMEESGVSKRVAVRFEDVSEDGHILPSAMLRAADASSASTGSESSAIRKHAA